MKIALFGGAFDPPHLGHKLVADSLIKNRVVDEVWFVPVFTHPWADRYGKRRLAEYEQRVKMLEFTIASNRTKEEVEYSQKQKVAHYKDISFTFNTLEFFSKEYPDYEFSWVMGSEYLSRFDDFLKGHPQLIDYPFYIYPRAGYAFSEDLKKENMIFLTNMPEIEASSTQVKERIKAKKSYKNSIPQTVFEFIEENKLYQ